MAMPRSTASTTRYEVIGSGPPLLMYSPGGFDATSRNGAPRASIPGHQVPRPSAEALHLHRLRPARTGQSGGRVERVGLGGLCARRARALLDHLGIEKAHLMGGCMGCSAVAAFGVAYPEATLSMVLFWPVGGARYRIAGHQRFAEHLAFVHQNGLAAVVELAKADGKAFGADPRGGPWVSVLRTDPDFAERYAEQDVEQYRHDRRRHGPHPARSRHGARCRTGGSAAPQHSDPDRAGLPTPRTRHRRRAIWRNAFRRRILGHAGLRRRKTRRTRGCSNSCPERKRAAEAMSARRRPWPPSGSSATGSRRPAGRTGRCAW